MTVSARTLVLSASLLALGACATVPAAPPAPIAAPEAALAAAPPPPAAPQMSAHDQLFQLFKDSDEANLKRNPINAIFRGDMRYADQFGDYISDAYYAGEKAAAESDLATLHSIDRASLDSTDQLAYDVFEYTTADTLKNYQPDILELTKVRPINHFSGFHTFYPTFSSGAGGAPFKTVADYDNALKRHAGYAKLLDAAVDRFRQGEAEGIFETKLTIRNVIAQLDSEGSPYQGKRKDIDPKRIAVVGTRFVNATKPSKRATSSIGYISRKAGPSLARASFESSAISKRMGRSRSPRSSQQCANRIRPRSSSPHTR